MKSLLVAIVIVIGIGLAIPTTDASAATYSCGTYGAGGYSQGGAACSNNNNVNPPNTGFAQLTKPTYYVPISLSLLMIIAGIALLVIKRKRSQA